jgi:hypothetical protein
MAKSKRALKNSFLRENLTAKGKVAFEKRLKFSLSTAMACAEALNKTMIVICKDGKILSLIMHFLIDCEIIQ